MCVLESLQSFGESHSQGNSRPLQNQQWSAVLDCAGSPALGTALSQLRYQGAAACIGVAGAATLEASLTLERMYSIHGGCVTHANHVK